MGPKKKTQATCKISQEEELVDYLPRVILKLNHGKE